MLGAEGAVGTVQVPESPTATVPGRTVWYSQAWVPSLAVLAFYGGWLLFVAASGHHDARDFIELNRHRILMSHKSSVIKLDPSYRRTRQVEPGYDGQFAYFIAIDPLQARYYMPDPAYRYTRILYPMVARAVALGNTSMIPLTLILVNLAAILMGTIAVAAWMRRQGAATLWSLAYGLFPGLFISLRRDLTEPLAFGLSAVAIYVLYFGGRRRVILGGAVLALAALTREEVAVFGVVFGLYAIIVGRSSPSGQSGPTDKRWDPQLSRWDGALVLVMTLAPLMAYKLFLLHWLGSTGVPHNNLPARLPFAGLIRGMNFTRDRFVPIPTVVLPAVIAIGAAAWALRSIRSPLPWLVIANAGLFVVLLNTDSYANYAAVGRVTTGVILSTVLCVPILKSFDRRAYGAAVVSIGLSLAAWLTLAQHTLWFPS